VTVLGLSANWPSRYPAWHSFPAESTRTSQIGSLDCRERHCRYLVRVWN